MNILLVSPLPPPIGGMATWTELYLKSKIRKNHNIDVIDSSVRGNRINDLMKKNMIEEIKRVFCLYKKLKYQLNFKKYDWVHFNISCSNLGMIRDYFFIKLIKKNGIKVILHCHCDTKYMINNPKSQLLFSKICNLSDEIIVLNKSSYNHIKHRNGKDSIIIPNFFDLRNLKVLKRKKIEESIKNIIYVGHIIKTKGCGEIIELAKQMPNINFKMIGYLSKEIEEIRQPKNIEYIGEVSNEDVINYMLEADLLLFPSHTEGFPNVILEAMACGLPIVATNVGAIPDMIENQCGIVVEVNDIVGMKAAIELLNSVEKRTIMSKWGIEKIKKTYDIDLVIDKIEKLYLEI